MGLRAPRLPERGQPRGSAVPPSPHPPPPAGSAAPLHTQPPEHGLPPSVRHARRLQAQPAPRPPRGKPAGTAPCARPLPPRVLSRPRRRARGAFPAPPAPQRGGRLGREPAERRPARRRPRRAGAGALRRGLRRRGEGGGIGGGWSSHAGLSRTARRRLSGLSAPPSIVSAPQPQSISYLSAPVNPPLIYVSFCC